MKVKKIKDLGIQTSNCVGEALRREISKRGGFLKKWDYLPKLPGDKNFKLEK